jgi:hypothetical protein
MRPIPLVCQKTTKFWVKDIVVDSDKRKLPIMILTIQAKLFQLLNQLDVKIPNYSKQACICQNNAKSIPHDKDECNQDTEHHPWMNNKRGKVLYSFI